MYVGAEYNLAELAGVMDMQWGMVHGSGTDHRRPRMPSLGINILIYRQWSNVVEGRSR